MRHVLSRGSLLLVLAVGLFALPACDSGGSNMDDGGDGSSSGSVDANDVDNKTTVEVKESSSSSTSAKAPAAKASGGVVTVTFFYASDQEAPCTKAASKPVTPTAAGVEKNFDITPPSCASGSGKTSVSVSFVSLGSSSSTVTLTLRNQETGEELASASSSGGEVTIESDGVPSAGSDDGDDSGDGSPPAWLGNWSVTDGPSELDGAAFKLTRRSLSFVVSTGGVCAPGFTPIVGRTDTSITVIDYTTSGEESAEITYEASVSSGTLTLEPEAEGEETITASSITESPSEAVDCTFPSDSDDSDDGSDDDGSDDGSDDDGGSGELDFTGNWEVTSFNGQTPPFELFFSITSEQVQIISPNENVGCEVETIVSVDGNTITTEQADGETGTGTVEVSDNGSTLTVDGLVETGDGSTASVTATSVSSVPDCPGDGGSDDGGSGDANQAPTVSVSAGTSTISTGDFASFIGDYSDPDGDELTVDWSFDTPSGSNASLSGTDGPEPGFTADVAGIYTATLSVSDGETTVTRSATVTVLDQTVTETTNALDGNVTFEVNGVSQVSYSVTAVTGSGRTSVGARAFGSDGTVTEDVSDPEELTAGEVETYILVVESLDSSFRTADLPYTVTLLNDGNEVATLQEPGSDGDAEAIIRVQIP